MSMTFQTDVKFLPLVGEKRAAVLKKELKISNVGDLLQYFPFRHSELFYTLESLKKYNFSRSDDKMPLVQLQGIIFGVQSQYERTTAIFQDSTGTIPLVWFNMRDNSWLCNINPNETQILFGEVSIFNGKMQIVSPFFREISRYKLHNIKSKFQAIYHATAELYKQFSQKNFQYEFSRIVAAACYEALPNCAETLPEYIISENNLLSLKKTYGNIHFSQSEELLKKAIFRIKFEEIFYNQINILRQRVNRKEKNSGFIFENSDNFVKNFYKNCLPFTLTNAQIRVLREIRNDFISGKQMNRLLQGDVGSGKTIVALISALIAIDNNYQACIMAPTEVLARQHFTSISKLTQNLGINVRLLIGATKKKEREEIHNLLKDGTLHILIGTHALIEDIVVFQNLGFAVIDEQHRFGVAQRAKLYSKNIQPPHVLAMSATPIPRTLAMTLYGDLDVSVIDELPPNRKPVFTRHFFDSKRLEVNKIIVSEIEKGHQIYVVYPLIQESEKLDLKNLENGYNIMCETFPMYKIAYLHGKMKSDQKDEIMAKFKSGETQILLSTTVIEVGVDVPNASVMLIESAQRFGLSQLHQLRGRVGRGAEQSFCILMSKQELMAKTASRLDIITQTNDGFKIAEADLTLRGPGMLEGTTQSGTPFDFQLTNIANIDDQKLLQNVRDCVNKILDEDTKLEQPKNALILKKLEEINKIMVDWGAIS
jgi:ATP-dependent DNA helicase RecG